MKRIQRQRMKGWRMPGGAVYVGRPTQWGNSWRVGDRWYDADALTETVIGDKATAVRAFRQDMDLLLQSEIDEELAPLRGKDLACWCPLNQTCHADVLLELSASMRR